MGAPKRWVASAGLVLALGCGGGEETRRGAEDSSHQESQASPPKNPPRPVSARLKELIEGLGSEDAGERQASSGELVKSGAGWTAEDMAALESAAQSPDAEIAALARGVCSTLLPRREIVAGLASLDGVEDALFGSGARRLNLMKDACSGWKEGKVPATTLARLADLSVDEDWGGLATLEFIAGFGACQPCRAAIVKLCDSEHVDTAAWAAKNAERNLFREAAPGVCRALERGDREDRFWWPMLIEAACALGVAEDQTLIERLSKSASAGAREACCVVLKRQFRRESAGVAARLASDPEPLVCHAAIQALCLFGNPEHANLVVQYVLDDQSLSEAGLEAFRGLFDEASLAPALESKDAHLRRMATWLLQSARRPRTLLEKGLHDPDEKVRSIAAYAAGRSKTPELVPALISALEDSSKEVANNAAIALGMLKDRKATGPLRSFLASGPAGSRESGISGLAILGDPAAETDILEAYPIAKLHSMNREDAYRACSNLGAVGGSEALRRLREASGENVSLCKLQILAWHGEPEDARLLDEAPTDLIGSWEDIQLFDALGAVPHEIERYLLDSTKVRARLAALSLRHLCAEPLPAHIETILNQVEKDPHADLGSVPDTVKVALGKADGPTTLRILGVIRAEGDEDAAGAMCEALLRTNDPKTWEKWIHEEKMVSDICTAEDAAAFLTAHGIRVDAASCVPFIGRVAAGQIISPRRLANRFAERHCPVFDGNSLRYVSPEEALRLWAERLAR